MEWCVGDRERPKIEKVIAELDVKKNQALQTMLVKVQAPLTLIMHPFRS